jgi:hypothetical protein
MELVQMQNSIILQYIAIDAEDNIYVSDWNNHKIRKVTPAGVVSTLAGSTLSYADVLVPLHSLITLEVT